MMRGCDGNFNILAHELVRSAAPVTHGLALHVQQSLCERKQHGGPLVGCAGAGCLCVGVVVVVVVVVQASLLLAAERSSGIPLLQHAAGTLRNNRTAQHRVDLQMTADDC